LTLKPSNLPNLLTLIRYQKEAVEGEEDPSVRANRIEGSQPFQVLRAKAIARFVTIQCLEEWPEPSALVPLDNGFWICPYLHINCRPEVQPAGSPGQYVIVELEIVHVPFTHRPGHEQVAPPRRCRDLTHQSMGRPIVIARNLDRKRAASRYPFEQPGIHRCMIVRPLQRGVRENNVELPIAASRPLGNVTQRPAKRRHC